MDDAETKSAGGRVSAASRGVLCLLVGLLWASGLRAQSPDEHASHHPGQAQQPTTAPGGMGPPAGVGPPGGAGGMGGMMEGMGEMMKGMGAPPPKELYPSLMALPDLPLAKRLEVEQQAGERMHSGVAMMNESLDLLLQAASVQNYDEMQAGTASLREGLSRFESGLAAQRALAEGKAPRNVALTWFKRDMNLLPLPGEEPRTLLGVTPFHLFTMVLLVAFALAMVAMYFFKMRRAAALFGRIEASKGAPPPGAAPELAGGKPPDRKKAPSGDKPAAPADKPPSADKQPSGDKPAPPADKPPSGDKPPSADKPAADDNKLATAAEKLAAAAEKLSAAAEKLATATDKPAAPADKPPSGDKPAGAADKLATAAEKLAAPADKPAADAPPKNKGSAPSVPAQERSAATKFACLAPAAREVFLVGTFNGWDAKATPMIKDAKGNWDVALALPPGRHEFKYVVDGDLCCEPGCEGPHQGCPKCVPNSSGTMNRFIDVTPI